MSVVDDWLKWIDEEIKHLDDEETHYGTGVRLRRGLPGEEEDITDSVIEANKARRERLELMRLKHLENSSR